MNEEKRKLAAIMFTDIVGYTAMMAKDERKALRILKKNRDFHKPLIERFNGEYLKEMGDGTLCCFYSALEAVNCAMEIQRSLRDDPELNLRIGIHVGDIVFAEGDIFGDGVNVASRIELIAEPGSICISERVYDDIRNKPDIEVVFLGEKIFKNLDHPIKVYSLTGEELKKKKKPEVIPSREVVSPQPTKKRFQSFVIPGILLFAAILIVAGYFFFSRTLQPEKPEAEKISEARLKNSIAVLPFRNMSADPEQEYFCEGMSEEIINALTHIEDLRVVARTSAFVFKEKREDIREIGRKLNVETLLEGSVRKADNMLRITAQLINVADGYHLWSERYDREMEDVFAIQDDISQAIVNALRIKLVGEEKTLLVKRYTEDTEAYNLYLKGRYFWNKRTEEGMKKSIEYYEQAIEKDPSYALAYSGLADTYNTLGDWDFLPSKEAYSKAKVAATKALEIDDLLAEAHSALAWVKHVFDWDWLEAEREFKRAIELNPRYPTAHQWYAEYLMKVGRHNEAIAEIKRAQELDPLSLIINAIGGYVFFFARQYDEAIEQSRKTLEIDMNFYPAHLNLGWAYEQKGMFEEAITEFQKAIRLSGGSSLPLRNLGHAYAMSGRKSEAKEILNELMELSKQSYDQSYGIALIYTGLGEKDQALEWLENVYKERSGGMAILKVDPRMDGLRDNPRFTELLKKIGLEK